MENKRKKKQRMSKRMKTKKEKIYAFKSKIL